MPAEVSYDRELHCVVLRHEGEFDMSVLADLATVAHRLLEEKGCARILNDLRQATVNLSTADIYELPEFISSSSSSAASARRALVVRADLDADDYRFFETVSRNQGQRVRLFTDMDEAKRWLQAADSPPPHEG